MGSMLIGFLEDGLSKIFRSVDNQGCTFQLLAPLEPVGTVLVLRTQLTRSHEGFS